MTVPQEVEALRRVRPPRTISDPAHDTLLRDTFGSRWLAVSKLHELEATTGLTYKRGRFTQSERRALHSAVTEYLSAVTSAQNNNSNSTHDNIIISERDGRTEDTTRLAFLRALFEDAKRGRKNALARNFFVDATLKLSPGRPVIHVYHFLRRQLHPGNNSGTWTLEEDAALRRAFVVRGPVWVEIGKDVGRFATACRDRYRKIRQAYQHGPWSLEEIQRLREGVQAMLSSRSNNNENNNNNNVGISPLNWNYVCEYVQTRSWMQCISKWAALTIKNGEQQNRRWTSSDDHNLCQRLYDMAYADDSEIEWNALLSSYYTEYDQNEGNENNGVPYVTVERLRFRWSMLKRRVDGWKTMDLDTLLETQLLSYQQRNAPNNSNLEPNHEPRHNRRPRNTQRLFLTPDIIDDSFSD